MDDSNLTRLPRGQREWPVFVEALSEVDDRAERYFLELKSDIDLTADAGRAKVAKFILGSANRMPDQAAKRFGGHALLVLGVAKGAIPGIPFFEAKDLERSVKRFIGADGPGWDFERVRASDDRDVIVVIVDPPRQGDPVWTCYRDGHENLKDGGIYIRADGETREAKGEEVRVLLRRAQLTRPNAELNVALLGTALPYQCDTSVLEEYISAERQRLVAAYNRHEDPLTGAYSRPVGIAAMFDVKPEDRTYEEYVGEIDDWENRVRAAWSKLLDEAAAVIWPGMRIRVQNLSESFLEDVEVTIHLEGEVWALDKIDDEYHDLAGNLPSPPRAWGPRQRSFGVGDIYAPSLLPNMPIVGDGDGVVSFRNGGSVDLTLPLSSLRPEEAFESDDDEFVLVVRDVEAQLATGTWRLTARGHHKVYKGTLSVDVDEPHDFSAGMRRLLTPKANDESEGES